MPKAKSDAYRRSVRSAAVLGALLAAACGSSGGSDDNPTGPSARTTVGTIAGTTLASGAEAFLGVPYAKPPVGALRFRAPEPIGKWDGVLSAKALKPACSQNANNDYARIANEDCLYVNVYRPAGTKAGAALPVYVYIHGGGYTAGYGGDYDGSKIAITDDEVVVMVDYRLNVFGFLATPELTAEQGITGNYGLRDQQEALRWVQANIAAFGGDPGNVTIGGQSAGAMSVCAQFASPLAAGLFQRIIMQSGVCTAATIQAAQKGSVNYLKHLGCTGTAAEVLSCLRSKTADEILDATVATADKSFTGYGGAGAVVDGSFLEQAPLEAITSGAFNHVPALIGNVHDEITGMAYAQAFTATSNPPAVVDQPTFEAWAAKLLGTAHADHLDLVKTYYHVSDFQKPIYAYGAIVNDSGWMMGLASCPQRRLAKTMADALGRYGLPVYDYEFNDQTMPEQRSIGTGQPATDKTKFIDPTISLGAYHAGDLKYTIGFETLTELNPAQLVLSDEVVKYWGAFVRRGDPNVPGQASWTPYAVNRDVMSFELPHSKLEADADFDANHRCSLVWEATVPQ
jgi:para-nitrobenzyl esterase